MLIVMPESRLYQPFPRRASPVIHPMNAGIFGPSRSVAEFRRPFPYNTSSSEIRMIRRTLTVFFTLLTLGAISALAEAPAPTAGPMIGHATDKSVRVWMQFPVAGAVTVNVSDLQTHRTVAGLRVGLEGPIPFVCDIPISELAPNRTYHMDVKFDGEAVTLPAPDPILRTAPPPGEEETFSIACGSGILISPFAAPAGTTPAGTAPAKPTPAFTPHKLPIFRAITDQKPRAFLFLGNVGTLPAKLDDFPSTHRAAFRFIADFHSALRREPDLQPLFRSTSCYGIFSDRDFGPANCDATYVFAQESLVAFQRFWPNPDWGTPENPGCYCTFSLGDADFFLLDTRTFRTAKTFLGAPQIAWLQNSLKASRATFKILAAPCTLWGDDPEHPDADSWTRFPAECDNFLRWLGDNRIAGIVALTGNHASGALTQFVPDPATHLKYPLFTLATSTLYRAHDDAGPANTFGTLDFAGVREHRSLTLRLREENGKPRLEQVLLAGQLKN
jgi:alkaline phosphatase D